MTEELIEGKLVSSVECEQIDMRLALVGLAQARDMELKSGAAGVLVSSSTASVTSGGAFVIVAGGDVDIKAGGAGVLVAGGDLNITAGGGGTMIAGGNLHLESGGASTLIAREAKVEKGFIGVLLSGRAEIQPGVRVLLSTPQAAVLGSVGGAVFALVTFFLGRLKARA
jgi:hypothetical protein